MMIESMVMIENMMMIENMVIENMMMIERMMIMDIVDNVMQTENLKKDLLIIHFNITLKKKIK